MQEVLLDVLCSTRVDFETNRMKKCFLLITAVLFILLKCTGNGTLFVDDPSKTPLTISAYISKAPPLYPLDTLSFTTADTIHTLDSLYLICYPSTDIDNASCQWDFGDGTATGGFVVSYAYSKGGHYRAIAIVSDISGFSISDTVDIHVNTVPTPSLLLLPENERQNVNTEVPLLFRWSGFDADNDTLTYELWLDTVNPPFTLITTQKDTFFSFDANSIKPLKTYYWKIIAKDKYDDFSVSESRVFTTKELSTVSLGALQGTVYRNNSIISDGITVTLLRNNAVIATAITDVEGSFFIDSIISGSVSIVYSNSQFYKPETISTTIVAGELLSIPPDTIRDIHPPFITTSPDTIIRLNSSVNIRISARDTFSTVEYKGVDFGNGFVQLEGNDSSFTLSSYGLFTFPVIASDISGNTSYDTIKVRVNEPPSAPQLLSPVSNARIEVNSNPIFSWRAVDPDATGQLKFAIYIGQNRVLTGEDLQTSNRIDSSYNLWNSSNVSRPFFWKVVATDGLDTSISIVDSFNVGRYTVSRIYGFAKLEGIQRHNGVKVILSGTQTYAVPTNDSGYVSIEVEPGTYTVTATDTLRNAFNTAVGGVTVLAGDSGSFGTLILNDSKIPVIQCVSPINGAIYSSLSPRNLTIQGSFTDTGSQVHVDSVRITLNGVPMPLQSVSSSLWQFSVTNIADGRYSFTVNASDSAGNKAIPLTRNFVVNSKTISASISFNHDTMYCTTSVVNVRPNLRGFYWNFNKHASPSWNDSTLTSSTTITYEWPLSHPLANGPDTLIVMAIDDSGMAVYDTVAYTITDDRPKPFAGNDTVVAMDASFTYVTLKPAYQQQFGHAIRYDWSINGGSFLRTGLRDTTIMLPSSYHPGVPCILRVTDNKSNVAYDTMYITVGREWELIGSGSIGITNTSSAVGLGVFSDNELYVGYADQTNSNRLTVKRWNGSAWTTSGTSLSSGTASYIQVAVGTGFGGYGGVQYSIPTVAFSDLTGSRVRVIKPSGDTVGSQSKVNGQYGAFRLGQTVSGMDGTMYLAFGDNTASDRIRVSRFLSGAYNWDSIGTLAASSANRAIDFSTDGSAHYLLLYKDVFSDTIKRFNGSSWQVLTALTNKNSPTIFYSSSLYMADRDNTNGNQLTVKYWNGAGWTYVGEPLTSSPSGVNNYHSSGSLGSVGLQKAGSYLCAAFLEWDEAGTRDSLKVKAFDGTRWNVVGVSGLPSQRVGFTKASFFAKNGRMYLAYANTSDGQIFVSRLK